MKGTILLTLTLLVAANGGELNHTKWKLIEINGQRLELAAKASASLTFEGDSYQLSGCNILAGKLYTKGEKLIFVKPVHTSRRACLEGLDAIDASFQGFFSRSTTYQTTAGQLTLIGEKNEPWVFQKVAQPSKNATTKVILVAASTVDCTGEASMKCLQVREFEYLPWMAHYSGIEGFEYVPGIEYRLRIKEDRIRRPAADGPSVAWYLDSVLDQKPARDYRADAR